MNNITTNNNNLSYEERTYPIRGKIIANFAMLEKQIELLLATEFSENNTQKRKLEAIVFSRMTFESKWTALNGVLLNRDTDGFLPQQKKGNPNKKVMEELLYLHTIRNQFIHYPTVKATSKTASGYVIGLAEYPDSPNTSWYTNDDIDEIVGKIYAVKSVILGLTRRKQNT